MRGFLRPKRCIKLDWNFQGSDVEAFKKNALSGGGMHIFWNKNVH